MGQWVFPTTRWALYLRDDLRCLYCQVTIAEVLEEREDNFLTLDHLRPRAKGTPDNSPANLMACCYTCNFLKGNRSVRRFCQEMGWRESTIRSRIKKRRQRDVEAFRPAAKLLLGTLPGVPGLTITQLVVDHDWLVKKQWGESIDSAYWEHLMQQEVLFCPTCGHSHEEEQELAEVVPLHPVGRWADEIDWNSASAPF